MAVGLQPWLQGVHTLAAGSARLRGSGLQLDIVEEQAVDQALQAAKDLPDQSYLVHEFVHHLQHLQRGDALFEDCPKVLAAETQAYAVQNRYLQRFKQWRRVGEILRFTHGPLQAQAEPEIRPGEAGPLASRSPVGP